MLWLSLGAYKRLSRSRFQTPRFISRQIILKRTQSVILDHQKSTFALAGSLVLILVAASSSRAQVPTVSAFQTSTQLAATAGKAITGVNITASVEWTAGSLHEDGTAQLQASADGSSSIQLSLGRASRSEVQSKTGAPRTCGWSDSSGAVHPIKNLNCMFSIPWFAPTLLGQTTFQMPLLSNVTDDGAVTRNGSTFHQISYFLDADAGSSAPTSVSVAKGVVKILYDPKTQLPAVLDYDIHPDSDDSQNLPVEILYSNYQSVAGSMVPFHIERYLQRTLELKLDVTNASIQ